MSQAGHNFMELLRSWLRGEARASDERRLESAAEEDAFLHEALEGFRRFPQGDHAGRVGRLRERLATRTRRRPVPFGVRRLAAAAAAAVLLFATLTVWWLTTPEEAERGTIAQETFAEQDAASAESTSPAQSPPGQSGNAENPSGSSGPGIALPPAGDALSQASKPVAPSPGPKPDLAIVEPPAGSHTAFPSQAAPTSIQADSIFAWEMEENADRPDIAVSEREKTAPEETKTTRSSNTPNLPDSGQARSGEISKYNEIPSRALSKKASVAAGPSQAAPEGGFQKLERYLKQNLKYPRQARKQKIEGIVRVQFDIQADGTLTDLHIIESLGFGCDEEAIRLLREGPRWRRPEGIEGPYASSYAIRFPLR